MHIRLLGEFSLIYGDRPVTTVNTARLQALLAYLVLHRDAPQLRYHLAFQFWPDSGESQARTNLRHLVHLLRQTLPHADDFLDAEGVTLQWRADAPWTLDVTEFESGVARGALREAVDLYRGDLLPACYDDWIMPERERLQQGYVKVLERLIQQLEGAQEYGAAIEYARRLLRHDPVREATYRQLMRLCALIGDRTGVARAYDTCMTVLQRELGLEPDVETREAYKRCLKLPASAHRGAEPATPAGTGICSNNLPHLLTHFIGRECEMREVRQLLAEHRLVTLTGAGGVGKTRLALAVAEDLVGAFADGVWQADLAPLTDPTLVVQTVASALGVHEGGGRPLLAQLTDYLREKHILLLLDNCEHLVEAVRLAAETWLDAAPHLQILITSRVVLGVAGEVAWGVPPLSVPDMDLSGLGRRTDAPDLTDLRQYESIQFFAERAATALPTFAMTPQNVEVVARICQQLEGIPLALELAAARVKLLTVQQIVERLNDPLRLLTQGRPTAPPRHQTLRATLDWSHALLSEPERSLFRRLAVFAGSFGLEAVEGTCSSENSAEDSLLNVLAKLVDQSLVAVEQSGAANRFRLHEVTRQYAAEKLGQWPSEEAAIRDRHCAYYTGFLRQRQSPLAGKDKNAVLAEIERELENVRLAQTWASAQGKTEEISDLSECLAKFYRALLCEAVDTLVETIGLGRLGFDAAIQEYVETSDNELARALRGYVRALKMFYETQQHLGEAEKDTHRIEEVRREALHRIAAYFNVPEVTAFVAAVLESQDKQVSLVKTLEEQARLLHQVLDS